MRLLLCYRNIREWALSGTFPIGDWSEVILFLWEHYGVGLEVVLFLQYRGLALKCYFSYGGLVWSGTFPVRNWCEIVSTFL